jgi:tetratricopeptide (TPR) repeat protein
VIRETKDEANTMTTDFDSADAPAPDKEPLIIKGSWEDLLQQAQQLMSQQNDEAIPRFEKIVQRLRKLPEAQRKANNERLQTILFQAIYQLQGYCCMRERYDEAIALLSDFASLVEESAVNAVRYQQIQVLLLAERTEEAVSRLRAIATAPEADISDWGALLIQSIRLGKLAEAAQTIDEATAWVAAQEADDALDDEERPEYHSYLADMRADLALAQGQWEEAEVFFQQAMAQNPLYQQNVHLHYTRLLRYDQPERALPYLQRDQQHPIRAGFWQGVALYRLGRREEAERQWQKVTKIDVQNNAEQSFSELVLAHYYLGDKERVGLSAVLQMLQESRRYDWQALFLVGLGWAIRGRADNAEANFQVAINQRRMAAQGKLLPRLAWGHCLDLLDAEMQERFAKYFETTGALL